MSEAAPVVDITSPERYVAVDSVAAFATARSEVRTEAESLMMQRRLGHVAHGEAKLIPVDPLSAAHAVVDAKRLHGEDSTQYHEARHALVLDSRRLYAEWWRKKRPEYFLPLKRDYDADLGDYFSNGRSLSQMADNGIVPMSNNPEEEDRRINEKIEDATPGIVKRLGGLAVGTVRIRTISECSETAIENYVQDIDGDEPEGGYFGYVPQIQKLMARDIVVDLETGDRWDEQMALPGVYITHDVIVETLNSKGLDLPVDITKTKLHGMQFFAQDTLIEFGQALDESASLNWGGVNIFMGELVPDDYLRDYEAFVAEAEERQMGMTGEAESIADYLVRLAEEDMDRELALKEVETYVLELIVSNVEDNLHLAAEIFDQKTADGLQMVAELREIGDYQAALELRQKVVQEAPGGGYCGAGSCGLKEVSLSTAEGQEIRDLTQAEDGDTILSDTERKCKKCGEKTLVYAFTTSKINTACTNCKSFRSEKRTGGK